MKKEIANSLFLTICIFVLNYFLRTMVYFLGDQITSTYYFHLTEFPFKLRPLTNFSIYYLSTYFKLSILHSFLLHQYLLLFTFFVSLSYFFKEIGFDRKKRILGLSLTALLFPILCIHFIPVYSWDDIWAYIFVVWTMYFVIKNKFWYATLFFFFALVERESMVLILPAFYIFSANKKAYLKWFLPAILPVLVYGVLRLLLFPGLLEGRFTRLFVNLQDADSIRHSFYSLFVSYGWMWAILFFKFKSQNQNSLHKNLNENFRLSAIIVSVLMIVIVFNTALIRETRLLFTPFIFIIPFVMMNFQEFIKPIVKLYNNLNKILFFGFVLLIFICTVLFSVFLFPSFKFLPMIDFHRVYFSLNLSFILLIILCKKMKNSKI